jgi:hypothetical protein
LTRSNTNGIWFKIAEEYYNNFIEVSQAATYNEALCLESYYSKNLSGFRSGIEKAIQSTESDLVIDSSINSDKSNIQNDLIDHYRQKKNIISEKCVDLTIGKEEWCYLSEKCISGSANRERFNVKFDNRISELLQDLGYSCVLRSTHNQFNKYKPVWSGVYNCVSSNCSFIAHAEIAGPILFGHDLKVHLEISGTCLHSKEEIQESCRGEDRKQVALKLRAFGTDNTRRNHLLMNYHNKNSKVL